jgi:hypothetical protein
MQCLSSGKSLFSRPGSRSDRFGEIVIHRPDSQPETRRLILPSLPLLAVTGGPLASIFAAAIEANFFHSSAGLRREYDA